MRTDSLHGHHREVLGPGQVGGPKDMPHHGRPEAPVLHRNGPFPSILPMKSYTVSILNMKNTTLYYYYYYY